MGSYQEQVGDWFKIVLSITFSTKEVKYSLSFGVVFLANNRYEIYLNEIVYTVYTIIVRIV